MPVHPRGDLAKLGEVRGVVLRRLAAGHVLEMHAVAPLTAGRIGDGHDAAPVGGGQHPRGAYTRLRPQRVHPGQLGLDLQPGVVPETVHAQDGRLLIGIIDPVGRVLRHVEQADRGGGTTAEPGGGLPWAPGDAVEHVTACRQVMRLDLVPPRSTPSGLTMSWWYPLILSAL